MYYVFPSLVNLSAVNSFSHFSDSAVPLYPTLLSSLMFLSPSLMSHSSYPILSIYVSCICSISLELRLLYSHVLTRPLSHLSLSLLVSTFPRFWNSHVPQIPEIPESRIPTLPHTQKSGIPEGFHREQGNTLSPPQ